VACADVVSFDDAAQLRQEVVGGTPTEPGDWRAVVSLGGCSGTLVASRLVLYAAHCGTAMSEVRFGNDAEHPAHVAKVDFCRAYPNARLGDGTDLAFCVLEDDLLDIQPARILAGCELEQLVIGSEVVLAGFGIDGPGGAYGLSRVASAAITDVGPELLIAGDGVDTCKGDSGGPVFLPLTEDSGLAVLRVAGVTSAGSSPECGKGIAHYVNLAQKIEWLEQTSGLDVTPCFAAGDWAPTPACASTACGTAGLPEADSTAPSLRIIVPSESHVSTQLASEVPAYETSVEAVAEDRQTGIERVTFTLRGGDNGATLMQRADEVPPYGLPQLRLPPGAYSLEATARNFSGQSAFASITFDIERRDAPTSAARGGCTIATPGRDLEQRFAAGALASLLLMAALARRRRQRRTHERDRCSKIRQHQLRAHTNDAEPAAAQPRRRRALHGGGSPNHVYG
jgi:hypothetical protein